MEPKILEYKIIRSTNATIQEVSRNHIPHLIEQCQDINKKLEEIIANRCSCIHLAK